MAVIGLDIGTSGCKAIAYRSDGKALAHAYIENKVEFSGDVSEINADQVWENVKIVLCQCAIQAGEPIDGIGISSFGESFIAVDESGNVLMPSMLYTDTRGNEEIGIMKQFVSTTKLMPHATFTLPKVLWFRKHCADVFRRTHHIFLFEDFIIFRLTGAFIISQSMAARTGFLDITSKQYSQSIMNKAELSPELFSKPMLPGTTCGIVRHLPPLDGAIVVTGGQDQVCAALGAGVMEEGDAVCGIGTVECITPLFKGILINDRMVQSGYCCIPFDTNNHYVTFAYNYTGGASIKWFARNLASSSTVDVYSEYERKATPLHNELLVLPHFAGAATPYMDINARAAILGITLATTQEDIYRAIMEGCCYEMRINLEQLYEGGISVKRLVATGGGAASSLWVQMKADIFNLPVQTLQNPEAGTVGAAILAGLATGMFSSKSEAVASLVQYNRTYDPQHCEHGYYEKKYSKYRLLYHALKKLDEVSIC